MFFGHNDKWKQEQQQKAEQRRRDAIRTEMEDVFGDIMDEMGM